MIVYFAFNKKHFTIIRISVADFTDVVRAGKVTVQ